MEGFDLPEITPLELSEWLREKPDLVLLDVREPYEVSYAALPDPRVVYVPMSELTRRLQEALPEAARDPQAEMVVFCHIGERSTQVADWLKSQGYARVFNLYGGLDAYAAKVDLRIARY
jgi:rhodanese-related sulfurtransferase